MNMATGRISGVAPLAVEREPFSVATVRSDRRNAPHVLRAEIEAKLVYAVGKSPAAALQHDWLTAAILVLRDRIIDGWMSSIQDAKRSGRKRVYYLSLEFLIGRLFKDALGNLGLKEQMGEALAGFGVDIDQIAGMEPDAALGNGGLGRLAACFMESMATVGVSGLGYGIRYDHGLFKQKIVDGFQVEVAEDWLSFRNPWEFQRREIVHQIGFGGAVEMEKAPDGAMRPVWRPEESVLAVAYDTPVVGWRGQLINTLRLWSARALEPFKLEVFNEGDHVGAHFDRDRAETISRVLYPSDATPQGQELRLRQEYFFTCASLQDLIRRHMQRFGDIRSLSEKAAMQLNDTHPAIAVAELMRLLVDVHGLTWDEAWSITRGCVSYTNHTLMPEALESWPVTLVERLLPRHMQIIFAINARFLDDVRKGGDLDDAAIAAISLIDENNGRRVRMGHLAFVGSRRINGVSALHTRLMKDTVFHELDKVLPGRIVNKTNGITPRRWLIHCNPGLTDLIAECIGDKVRDDVESIREFARFADDAAARECFAEIKLANKVKLAVHVQRELGLTINPHAVFDVHVKRIHEYKRQLLNIVETIALYDAMRSNPNRDWTPRVKIFAGKAAASYVMAKSIIKLVNDVARVVNADPAVRDLLTVVFLPNFNVSLAELIVPAADISEQISTAGLEASGTGNMKFALNGAITIGTLDGANVEIRERVGEENIMIFGLTADQVLQARRDGYSGRAAIESNAMLREALLAVRSGVFSAGDRQRFAPLVEQLMNNDYYMVAADFQAYFDAHRRLEGLWRLDQKWQRMAMLNTAHVGWFSSDRTIREYAEDIWQVPCDFKLA